MASVQPSELPLPPAEEVTSSTPEEVRPFEPEPAHNGNSTQAAIAAPPLSKNALKRMRKDQEWEAGKDERRKKRKEKRQERRIKKRDERKALVAQGLNPWANSPRKQASVNVPISLVLDCEFEEYMMEKEIISLGSQVTRSYSENRTAKFRTHLYVSGWKGKLHDRFRDVLEDKHKNWKGIDFLEGDFVQCAEQAQEQMKKNSNTMTEALQRSLDEKVSWVRDETDPLPLPDPEPEPNEEYKDIVYLSSDSPYTLERLEPYTTYIIGGLVDKNREKGLCYKRARERGIRTARLPIGQYMVMQSRAVLATNHVVEIMLRWLEFEDWGQAFLSVIPKRKGGQLKGRESVEGEGADESGED
ncbi:Fc.00g013940.m01.CDS01 [Cosmosporella sp. VM-42]